MEDNESRFNECVQAENERFREALLSLISHDLRTPLTSIMGASSSLLDENLPLPETTRRDLLHLISEETLRLHRLVSNLLELARLQAGALILMKEWQPFEEVVGATLYKLKSVLEGRAVITDLPDDSPFMLFDAILIERVLLHLLENAINNSPPDSPIQIVVRNEKETVTVEVCDAGPGLPPSSEGAIFEPFLRATQAPGEYADTSNSGTGLGLAICRAIIEAHGGAIQAENGLQCGAIFRFTLPLDSDPPETKSFVHQDV